MSDTAVSPSIFRLNDDVLLSIFELNANIFTTDKDYGERYDVLDTTRFASQVCSSWRALILSKTSIWAHLINFNHFHGFQSTVWVQEIIRRAGDTAPLWIKATSSWTVSLPPADALLRFFQIMINQHWDRTEKLLLSGSWLAHLDLRNSPLYRPASILNMFHLQISDSPTGWVIISKNQSQMFPGSPIPIYALNKNIELRAPWVHTLHSLSLSPVYRIRECLAVLSATPNLQYLQVTSLLRQMKHFSRPVVALPKLKDLTLSLNSDRMTFVLDHLKFPPQCAVHLTTYEVGSVVVTPVEIISTLSQTSQTYFKSCPPRMVDVSFGARGTVSVCNSERIDDCIFRLLCPSFNDVPDYTRNISTALSLREFASVTELKLHYDFAQIAAPDFSFLKFFSSVETLHIDEELLCHITTQNPEIGTVMFPKLQVVMLRSPVDAPLTLGDNIIKFVLSRIEVGYPISVLNIMACKNPENYYPTIELLQSISGMKVISRAV